MNEIREVSNFNPSYSNDNIAYSFWIFTGWTENMLYSEKLLKAWIMSTQSKGEQVLTVENPEKRWSLQTQAKFQRVSGTLYYKVQQPNQHNDTVINS